MQEQPKPVENAFVAKLHWLFGGINMAWPKVIVFAVVTGAYTGIVNLIPALHDTSLSSIAVTWEAWVLFALIVACNCKKAWESALKVFVFFLISQPLVYLVDWSLYGHFPWE